MRSAAMLLPFFMLASTALADDTHSRTISTSGTATVHVVPDEATIRFSVHTFDKDLPQSKELNDKASAEALAFLKSLGIDTKDIQSTSAESTAVYDYRQEYNRQIRGPIVGYDVTRSYGLKLKDLTKLEAIYDKFLPDTRISLEGQTLSTSELRKHRDQARLDAAKAAREKAEALAAACDSTVGAAREISESVPFVGYYGRAQGMQTQSNFNAASDGVGGGADVSLIGQIEVQATVAVVYDLVPNPPAGK